MATAITQLRSKAKAAGVPASLIRANMYDAHKLEALIAGVQKGKSHVSKMKSNKGVKVAKPKPVARAKRNAEAKAAAPKKQRGRPVGSKNKPKTTTKTTARKSTPVRKPTRTTARKQTTARKPAPKTTARTRKSDSGRNTIESVDFTKVKGWNPRPGSAVDLIWKALKRAKGNRDRAFEILKPDVAQFVDKTKADGSLRPKGSKGEEPGGMYHMLRYRISRTLFDFAVQTGQHKSSTNRIEYGSGTNGTKSKPKRKAAVQTATKRKPAAKPVAAKRGPGRPKGSTNKPKPASRRTTTRAGRR